ncbi:MAG: metalloregulator ArsR/SmtB family transcription factor [Pseudomonadota bacterium]|nr:metalloregulator ArsR/SmtB family transcription factor [Pseudomonadota bacterium]MEC9408956.1 metalloregulator ArsR/SmtB family transcription factor [Pseudomonadota bacterium]
MTPVELMKLLADETRLTSVIAMKSGPRCVCDLMEILQLSQPKVSRHLAILREAGLVETERRGQWVYYSLVPKLPAWVDQTINALAPVVIESVMESTPGITITPGESSACC